MHIFAMASGLMKKRMFRLVVSQILSSVHCRTCMLLLLYVNCHGASENSFRRFTSNGIVASECQKSMRNERIVKQQLQGVTKKYMCFRKSLSRSSSWLLVSNYSSEWYLVNQVCKFVFKGEDLINSD